MKSPISMVGFGQRARSSLGSLFVVLRAAVAFNLDIESAGAEKSRFYFSLRVLNYPQDRTLVGSLVLTRSLLEAFNFCARNLEPGAGAFVSIRAQTACIDVGGLRG